MDQATNAVDDVNVQKHISKLFGKLQRFLDEKHISDEERFRIGSRLGETIHMELLLRVDEKNSGVDKTKFISALQQAIKNPAESGALQGFIHKKFSEDDRNRILTEAIENVLNEFVEKLKA